MSETVDPDSGAREQLSDLQSLLVLSMVMMESGDEGRLLDLATTSVASLGPFQLNGVHLIGEGWRTTGGACASSPVRADVEAQLPVISAAGGAVSIPGHEWGWAFALRSLDGHFGYLVVSADARPSDSRVFLLRVLAQQTAIALANQRLHARQRASAEELRAANATLGRAIEALQRSTAIHDRLTSVSLDNGGQDGIAHALHELTGHPIAIEDKHGNLRAWAGLEPPHPYPKAPPEERTRLLRRTGTDRPTIRDGDRLITVAGPVDDVLGVVVLFDPDGTAGESEHVALEHGATVLAVELARLRSLAEAEHLVGRDLVDDLLRRAGDERVLERAQALGYDLQQPHRVVVIEGHDERRTLNDLLHAVRRSARDLGIGSLLAIYDESVVLFAQHDGSWPELRAAVVADIGGSCRVGVGGACASPSDLPRSHREALAAIRVQRVTSSERTTVFDELGVYRLFASIEETDAVEAYVRGLLGELQSYDERRGSELVRTLASYLDAGCRHEPAATALSVHPSTLKYRLQRIRAISGHDLTDPGTQFNLHLATSAWQTLLALRSAP